MYMKQTILPSVFYCYNYSYTLVIMTNCGVLVCKNCLYFNFLPIDK